MDLLDDPDPPVPNGPADQFWNPLINVQGPEIMSGLYDPQHQHATDFLII